MRISDWSSDVCSSDLAQRLVRTPVVVELDPVTDHPHCMLLGFKAVPVRALLFQGPDDPLHHAVLLRTVRRDELLLQAIAAHQTGVVAAGKHQDRKSTRLNSSH